jgi:hypothetical protein
MSMMLVFNRKVIPIPSLEKGGAARVETIIAGYIDGEVCEVGQVNFPNKQSWTKFWGAIQRGALNVPDMEVKMLNVPPEEEPDGDDTKATDKKGVIP